MPTNRTPINRNRHPRITDVTLKQFDRLLEIELADDHREWEEEGGRLRESLDLAGDILAALQVEPWDMAPPGIEAAAPPQWVARFPALLEKWNAARSRYLAQRVAARRRLLGSMTEER
jgi:hypothetical protein